MKKDETDNYKDDRYQSSTEINPTHNIKNSIDTYQTHTTSISLETCDNRKCDLPLLEGNNERIMIFGGYCIYESLIEDYIGGAIIEEEFVDNTYYNKNSEGESDSYELENFHNLYQGISLLIC